MNVFFTLYASIACMACEAAPALYRSHELDINECDWRDVQAYLLAWDVVYESVPDMVDEMWIRRYGITYPEWREDVREYYGLY